MHRLTAPEGYLLIITCCFEPEEISAALDTCDSLFASDSCFQLVTSYREEPEPDTTGVAFCLYRKVSAVEPPSAVWEWQHDQEEFTPYDAATSALIEEAYQRGGPALEVPLPNAKPNGTRGTVPSR